MAEQTNGQNEVQETNRPDPVDLDGFRSEVEWLRKELTDTRKEAGRYRTERNTLREEMKGKTSLEEFQELQTKYEAVEKKAAHDALIAKYASDLPDPLRNSVSWPDDEAGIKAKADELSEFAVPVNQGANANPSGGLGSRGHDVEDDFDPAALAAEIPR